MIPERCSKSDLDLGSIMVSVYPISLQYPEISIENRYDIDQSR